MFKGEVDDHFLAISTCLCSQVVFEARNTATRIHVNSLDRLQSAHIEGGSALEAFAAALVFSHARNDPLSIFKLHTASKLNAPHQNTAHATTPAASPSTFHAPTYAPSPPYSPSWHAETAQSANPSQAGPGSARYTRRRVPVRCLSSRSVGGATTMVSKQV